MRVPQAEGRGLSEQAMAFPFALHWIDFCYYEKPREFNHMKVSIVGLGKLGLPMAVAIAKRGIQVYGVERDPKRVRQLQRGESPIDEPGIQPKLKSLIRNRRLILTSYSEALSKTDAAFIAVNTPERSLGEMDTRDLETCVSEIGRELKHHSKFYVLAVASTIVPETIDGKIRPLLEKTSGRKVGKSIGLCANPVFIALSSVIRDYLNPPVVVLGATDPRTSRWMAQFYKQVCENKPPILTTTPLTAEVIKLTHNAYCTSKMAFINETADLCSQSPGADIRKVEEFFRVGGERTGRFLKSGLGFGGPCFPRDLRFFVKYMEKKGLKSPLLKAINVSNEEHAHQLIKQIRSQLGSLKGKKVALLGLSYKPGVRNFEDSFSFRLIQKLEAEKARVFVYDPLLVPHSPGNGFFYPVFDHRKLVVKKSMREALEGADLCVLAHPLESFNLKQKDLSGMARPLVFNPWEG